MQPEAPAKTKMIPYVKLGILAVFAGAAGILVLKGLDYRMLLDRGFGLIRSMGPWSFFAATAVLPAFGVPLSVFTITAGELFSPLMTTPGVIAATLAAIAVDLALNYWLARYALRPVLSKIIRNYGYSIPSVTRENALAVVLAVRLTPGPPFFIQGCICGMAEIPFRLFMIVAWLAVLPWAIGAIVLGKGIFNGNFKLVSYGIGVIVVATIAVHWVRKRYVKRPA